MANNDNKFNEKKKYFTIVTQGTYGPAMCPNSSARTHTYETFEEAEKAAGAFLARGKKDFVNIVESVALVKRKETPVEVSPVKMIDPNESKTV